MSPFKKNYSKHREIFNSLKLSKYFRYTNKEISNLTLFNESKLSRFFTGKRDLSAGEFFYLLESMPQPFQEQFLYRYNPTEIQITDLEIIIENMDIPAIGDLLKLIGAVLNHKST